MTIARPRKFNEDDVIDKAVKVFWAKGYEAASIQDLVDTMGIQRGSLYATFGGKQPLFLKSLKRYSVTVVSKLLEILRVSHLLLSRLSCFSHSWLSIC